MNQIECPNCGWRNLNEFRYGGEQRPPPAQEGIGLKDWGAYLYRRRNPRGVLHEWWYHRLGCGVWFIAERHTQTHALHSVRRWSPPEAD